MDNKRVEDLTAKATELLDNRKNTAAFMGILVMGILILGIGLGAIWYYTMNTYMTMAGEDEVTIGLYGYYDDPGVEARISGKNVTDRVSVKSNLDTSKPGTYEIEYTAGHFRATRTIEVLDEMSPKLKLAGDAVYMTLGEEYEEPGYEAEDEEGNDLTDRVKVEGLEENRAGNKLVTYTVTDDEGRATRLTRKVNIRSNKDRESPGLPICMYHYVYDEMDPPDDLNRRYGNYISLQALQEEVDWLKSEDYYFPTWEEVRDYVDGKLILPEKSIVLTFDDGEKKTLKKLVPFVESNKVPVTSFLITSKDGKDKTSEYVSRYLDFQSHTHDMHRGGGVKGHRGVFPVIAEEEGLADLATSIEICGSKDAFAYPYGDYNESSKLMLEKAGFLCAVTTQPGKVFPGDDPLLLHRQRMSQGQSLETFISKVAPPEVTQEVSSR